MNQDKLKNLIASIPTEQLKSDEIEPFIQQMRKHLIEQALQGEMDAHLDYDRYERHSGTNSRNGSSKKTLKTEKGPIAISVPRDRDGSFKPKIVPKGQTRTGALNDQIFALCSKGMSVARKSIVHPTAHRILLKKRYLNRNILEATYELFSKNQVIIRQQSQIL